MWMELSRALDVLEHVQADLAELSRRTDEARRYELIRLRKRLAEQIAEVGRAAEQLLKRLQDADLTREYRARFSRMRSTVALHQANWPAVHVDEANSEYQRAIKGIRDVNADFFSWIRPRLAPLAV